MTAQEFLYWLQIYLEQKDWGDLTSAEVTAKKRQILAQERDRVAPVYGPAALPTSSPYYPQVNSLKIDYERQVAPPTPEAYYSPNVQVVTQGGRVFGYLYDTTGNLIDIRDYGVAETGGLTAYQQQVLDFDRQQLAVQQQQWAQQQAYQQQQLASQQAYQQQQLSQQGALSQAEMELQAQLGTLPYGQMTASDLAAAQQNYQQYQAEMMANPSRFIEAYYGQQQPPPWYMGQTPTTPTVNVPQIPLTPPIDYSAQFAALEAQVQAALEAQAEALATAQAQATYVQTPWQYQTPEQLKTGWATVLTPQQKKVRMQQVAKEGSLGRALKPSPYV